MLDRLIAAVASILAIFLAMAAVLAAFSAVVADTEIRSLSRLGFACFLGICVLVLQNVSQRQAG